MTFSLVLFCFVLFCRSFIHSYRFTQQISTDQFRTQQNSTEEEIVWSFIFKWFDLLPSLSLTHWLTDWLTDCFFLFFTVVFFSPFLPCYFFLFFTVFFSLFYRTSTRCRADPIRLLDSFHSMPSSVYVYVAIQKNKNKTNE